MIKRLVSELVLFMVVLANIPGKVYQNCICVKSLWRACNIYSGHKVDNGDIQMDFLNVVLSIITLGLLLIIDIAIFIDKDISYSRHSFTAQ